MLTMSDQELVERAQAAIAIDDFPQALELLSPLVQNKNTAAMTAMGLLLQNGMGVRRDISKAVALLEEAARLGDGYAAHNLGTLFAIEGPNGSPEPALSRYWYLRAYDLGAIVAAESWYSDIRAMAEGDKDILSLPQ
jgi:TPR repeat protein